MNRGKLLIGLLLLNCAVFVASVNFTAQASPFEVDYYASKFSNLKHGFQYHVPWLDVAAIMLTSILATSGFYHILVALRPAQR